MKNSKAQGLSMNVIVIAVIALIIMVIIIAIAGGKLKLFGKTASSCEQKGGSCIGNTNNPSKEGTKICGDQNKIFLPGTDCQESEVCCVEL
jgi:hypothetical protein